MTDTPKFTVIDRRKMKAEEEQENPQPAAPAAVAPPPAPESGPGPGTDPGTDPGTAPAAGPRLVVSEPEPAGEQPELPPAPTAQESTEQKTAYDASAQRLE